MTHLTIATVVQVLAETRGEAEYLSGAALSCKMNNAEPEIMEKAIDNLIISLDQLEIMQFLADAGGISCDDNPAFRF
jgi:hypothetical protein